MRWPGIAAVILAAMLWGTTGTVQTLLPPGRDPVAVGALRLAFGALALVALALARPETRRALPRLPWAGIVAAGLSIGAYNLVFFWAVAEAGVGIGTAIAIGSAPVWATGWEVLAARRMPAPLRLAGQGVSIAGVAILALGGGAGAAGGAALGALLALAAGACYAAYSLFTSAVGRRAPSTAIAAATFTVAALATLPALAFVPLDWLAGWRAWAGVIYLGVGATALSYALYTWGLTRVAASTAVTLALAEPVTAWLLATFQVGEPVTLRGTLGAGLILAGLAVVAATPVRRTPRKIP